MTGRLACVLCMAALLAFVGTAHADSRVLVLHGDRVTTEYDHFVPDAPPMPPALAAQGLARSSSAAPGGTVQVILDRLLSSGQISQPLHDQHLATWRKAIATRDSLRGERRLGLTHAIGSVGALARRGQLTPSRLNLAFHQLGVNIRWWSRACVIPSAGTRIRLAESWLLFQRVPGQGLQFHALANWGRVQAMLQHGYVSKGLSMISELLPLGSERGGALTWEYLFYFRGGAPPWTSGLSQGSALVALSAAYRRTHNPRYADALRRALALYELPAPLGVRVPTRWGNHYAEYSYAPRYRVINGFVQALNGLWDTWHVLGDGRAAALFRAGDSDARRSLPGFDTGRWSRYDNRGTLSDLNYHVLLRDFLSGLCQRSRIGLYCAKASRFSYYLRRVRAPVPRSGANGRPPIDCGGHATPYDPVHR